MQPFHCATSVQSSFVIHPYPVKTSLLIPQTFLFQKRIVRPVKRRCVSTKRDAVTAKRVVKSRRPRADSANKDDPWIPEKLGFLEVGVIVGSHGVHGEAKVLYSSDFPKRRLSSSKGDRFILLPGRRYPRPVTLLGGRQASQASTWIVKIDGYDSPEKVNTIRKAKLFIKQNDRPGLRSGEFLVADLVGLPVFTSGDSSDSTSLVGKIVAVILRQDIGAVADATDTSVGHDLLEIQLCSTEVQSTTMSSGGTIACQRTEERKFLIPLVRDLVPEIDLQAQRVIIRPPPGLVEITKVYEKNVKFLPKGLLCTAK